MHNFTLSELRQSLCYYFLTRFDGQANGRLQEQGNVKKKKEKKTLGWDAWEMSFLRGRCMSRSRFFLPPFVRLQTADSHPKVFLEVGGHPWVRQPRAWCRGSARTWIVGGPGRQVAAAGLEYTGASIRVLSSCPPLGWGDMVHASGLATWADGCWRFIRPHSACMDHYLIACTLKDLGREVLLSSTPPFPHGLQVRLPLSLQSRKTTVFDLGKVQESRECVWHVAGGRKVFPFPIGYRCGGLARAGSGRVQG